FELRGAEGIYLGKALIAAAEQDDRHLPPLHFFPVVRHQQVEIEIEVGGQFGESLGSQPRSQGGAVRLDLGRVQRPLVERFEAENTGQCVGLGGQFFEIGARAAGRENGG